MGKEGSTSSAELPSANYLLSCCIFMLLSYSLISVSYKIGKYLVIFDFVGRFLHMQSRVAVCSVICCTRLIVIQ